MLIKLTNAASGKVFFANTNDIHRISEPQPPKNAADAERYANSRSIVEYNRPHPTRPNEFAFDFVRETTDQIAGLLG